MTHKSTKAAKAKKSAKTTKARTSTTGHTTGGKSRTEKYSQQHQPFTDWYELWLKQNKAFFNSANENLQHYFKQQNPFDPTEHMELIERWLGDLKKQWKTMTEQKQENAADYFLQMNRMLTDASDLMLKNWINHSREHGYIDNIQDLYNLWLHCCEQTYPKYTNAKDFEKGYGDFMNCMIKYWKSHSTV